MLCFHSKCTQEGAEVIQASRAMPRGELQVGIWEAVLAKHGAQTGHSGGVGGRVCVWFGKEAETVSSHRVPCTESGDLRVKGLHF